MVANGHFAPVMGNRESADYEHGVQVVDENKEFKYVLGLLHWFRTLTSVVVTAPTCQNT